MFTFATGDRPSKLVINKHPKQVKYTPRNSFYSLKHIESVYGLYTLLLAELAQLFQKSFTNLQDD